MHPMLRAALCLATLAAAPLAHADGFGYHSASPVYAPPGPVVQTPVAVVDEEPSGSDRQDWQRRAWFEFDQAAAFRAQQQEVRLGNERAAYLAQWGWNPARMAWFDQHQANERAGFAQDQANRRAAFLQQLAYAAPGDDSDHGEWEHHRKHHKHKHHDDDED
jgi:hypothetical protein